MHLIIEHGLVGAQGKAHKLIRLLLEDVHDAVERSHQLKVIPVRVDDPPMVNSGVGLRGIDILVQRPEEQCRCHLRSVANCLR
jgi:hypothetical protein